MDSILHFLHYLLHIDSILINLVANYGTLTYVLLFAIIFCETGLVVTPFLPGDSLLFAAGSLAANQDAALNIQLLFMLLVLASIFGNKVNYLIGRYFGRRLFKSEGGWLLNKKHLTRTHGFYEKHGGKTIIFARFLPIIRTFAPFVAGMGHMELPRFAFFNMLSAVLWVGSLLAAGYFLGSIPIVQQHFSIIVYAIISVSLLPPLVVMLKHSLCPNSL